MKNSRGFTLIELLIVVAIAAITLSFAVNGFRSITVTNRLATDVNDLVSSINLARSEAVKRGGVAGLVANGGDWSAGWDIRIDSNGDRDVADSGDTLIRSWRNTSASNVLSNDDGLTTLLLDARGGIGAETEFTLKPKSGNCTSGDVRVRTIKITISGHASVTQSSCP